MQSYIELLQILPDDLIEYIYSFLHKSYIQEHKVKSLPLIKSIPFTFIKRKLMNGICTVDNDSEHIISIFNKCKCCSSHQIDRPKYFGDFDWLLTENVQEPNMNPKLCSCPCRHYSRRLCVALIYN